MFNNVLLVFLGGGLGSVCRYLLAHFVSQKIESTIPLGTLMVNVLGSLLLGLVVGYIHKNQLAGATLTILFTIGFCGGFTTFSTLAYENVLMLKGQEFLWSIMYTSLSLLLGIGAAYVGLSLFK